jgi:hypothetical protein
MSNPSGSSGPGSAGQEQQLQLIGTVIVYDTTTGRIIHTHQFVHGGRGEPPSDGSMEQQALKAAESPGSDRSRTAALHHRGEPLDANAQYRVDLDTKSVHRVSQD